MNRVLLSTIIDLFMGTIFVRCSGDNIFMGSKDDFWEDPYVLEYFNKRGMTVNNVYVSYLEASYHEIDTIEIELIPPDSSYPHI